MGWELRGSKQYFYSSARIEGEPRKIYHGSGSSGRAHEILDRQAARRRVADWKEGPALRRMVRESDKLWTEVGSWLRLLADSEMLLAGWYRHRGEWRRLGVRPGFDKSMSKGSNLSLPELSRSNSSRSMRERMPGKRVSSANFGCFSSGLLPLLHLGKFVRSHEIRVRPRSVCPAHDGARCQLRFAQGRATGPVGDEYLEYDSSGRVTKAVDAAAGCSASSGGLGDFTYAYSTNASYSGLRLTERPTHGHREHREPAIALPHLPQRRRSDVNSDSHFDLSGLTYFTSTSLGTSGTNFYRTIYDYDDQERQDRMVTPQGTITRTVFDALGRTVSQWIGTDDTPTTGEWGPSNTSGTDLVMVSEFECSRLICAHGRAF